MKSLFLFLFLSFVPVAVWSQTTGNDASKNIEITFSGGIDFLSSNFHSGEFQFFNNEMNSNRGVTGVLSITRPITKRFFFGADAGLTSGSCFVNTGVRSKTEGYEIFYLGHYEENRFHVFFVPEIRLMPQNQIFLKAGFGVSRAFNSHFNSGTQTLPGNQTYDLKGEPASGSGFLGGFVGAGFQIPVIKKLGIKLEVRRYILPSGATSDGQIIFHFDHLAVQGGLTFTL